jgi:hypothetical protein
MVTSVHHQHNRRSVIFRAWADPDGNHAAPSGFAAVNGRNMKRRIDSPKKPGEFASP